MSLSRKARRAIAKYGEAACIKAHHINSVIGEGASTIAFQGDLGITLTTRQVDAAIDAGRELADERRVETPSDTYSGERLPSATYGY